MSIKAIHEGQKAKVNGYQQALREIRSGRKTGHWIWYIWPSLAEVRKTSRPQYSLKDPKDVEDFTGDPQLRQNLIDISVAAREHLEKGVKPEVLFGSRSYSQKTLLNSIEFY